MTGAGGDFTVHEKLLEASDNAPDVSKIFSEILPREAGEKRAAWFYRLSRAVGIKPSRIKDLYYDPRCKMWAGELAMIQQKQRVLLEHQICELQRRQAVIAARLRSIGGDHEIHQAGRSRSRSGRGVGSGRPCVGT